MKQTYASMMFSVWPWDRQRGCAVCTPPLGKQLLVPLPLCMVSAELPRHRYPSVLYIDCEVSACRPDHSIPSFRNRWKGFIKSRAGQAVMAKILTAFFTTDPKTRRISAR